MSEPEKTVPEAPEGFQRRHFGDQRDDFDDEFGRVRTPAEIAKRKLRVPAIMHIVTASFCLIGTLIGAVAILVDAFEERYWRDEGDEVIGVLLASLALAGGGFLFGTVLAGGVSMMKLRRRRLSLVAAYIVTGLSLAGPYGILFYPFGIWALVLLYSESVKREFGAKSPPGSPTEPRPPSEPKPRLTVRLFLIMGKIGFPIMLFVLGMLVWDCVVYPRFWTTMEMVWSIGITVVVAGMFGGMLAYGLIAQKKFKPSTPVASPPKIDDDFDD